MAKKTNVIKIGDRKPKSQHEKLAQFRMGYSDEVHINNHIENLILTYGYETVLDLVRFKFNLDKVNKAG
jgi:hypothetical protein